MRNLLLFLVLMAVAGCSYNPITNPKPLFLDTEIDYGPPEYRQGYHDGCQSALSAYGSNYQKTIYGIAKTPEYQKSKVYNQVWKDSWNYCYMWMFVQRAQATRDDDDSPF